MNVGVLKAYIDHFLPREIVGPVLVVFSLEGVIDGLFTVYVPDKHATIGWGILFVASMAIMALWGATDDQALEELDQRVEEIQAEGQA